MVGKLVQDPFVHKSRLCVSLNQHSDFWTVSFYCLFKLSATQIYWNCGADNLVLERKRGLELISLTHFLHDFWEKNFFSYSIN